MKKLFLLSLVSSLFLLLAGCESASRQQADACSAYGYCPDQIVDPGTAPWEPVARADIREECGLEPALLERIVPPGEATFAVVRHGKLCFVSGENGSDATDVNHVFSATKTLGALLTGMVMYETRDLPESNLPRRGPLREWDRMDKWLDLTALEDDVDIHPDATVAHVLSMEAYNDSLAYGEKRHRYDASGRREINQLIRVIDNVVAQDPERFGADAVAAKDRLFARLGLEHSSWSVNSVGYSWYTSLTDMARVGLAILNGGIYNGERIADAGYIYNMTHPAFEDGSTRYGYLTWMSNLECAPPSVHRAFPHGLSEARSCLVDGGCEQRFDVGPWSANGARGQFIVGHRGLDLVLVGQNWQVTSANQLWAAVRPALVAADPRFRGDDEAFCSAYGSGDYAPDLKMWEGKL